MNSCRQHFEHYFLLHQPMLESCGLDVRNWSPPPPPPNYWTWNPRAGLPQHSQQFSFLQLLLLAYWSKITFAQHFRNILDNFIWLWWVWIYARWDWAIKMSLHSLIFCWLLINMKKLTVVSLSLQLFRTCMKIIKFNFKPHCFEDFFSSWEPPNITHKIQ